MKQLLSERNLLWFYDDTKKGMILSNDIDSLFACETLRIMRGWTYHQFYDFKCTYDFIHEDDYESVGIDVALMRGKTIDNHVVKNYNTDYYNVESINLNVIEQISSSYSYSKKYAGSTTLEVLSLLDFSNEDMMNLTEEQQMFLLAIDCTFKGYYFGYKSCEHFLNILNYSCLIDLMKRHILQDFYDVIIKYNLMKDIKVKNHCLSTDIYIEDIQKLFKGTIFESIHLYDDVIWLDKKYETDKTNRFFKSITDENADEYYSLAFNYKNSAIFTKF